MSLPRIVVLIFGAVYLLVGVLGFVATTGSAPADMPSADGLLLGLFPVNALHNIVHLLVGAVLLYGATSTPAALNVARGVGILYLILGVVGIIAPDGFGLVPLGGTDVFLHFATAAVLLLVGFMSPSDDRDRVGVA